MTDDRTRWDQLARDPYYAVLAEDRYRGNAAGTRDEFFQSGEAHVAKIFDAILAWVDPAFRPQHAVDFGCGVGRLVIPLARRSGHVTGVDISQTMLDEARRNCAARDIANVDFVLSDAFLAVGPTDAPRSGIDFAHSFIVLQHISPKTGERIFDHFLAVLRPGGVGALHFTYARRASVLRKTVHRLRRWVPGLNAAVNIVQRRPVFEPQMPMYEYDLARLLARLMTRGCSAAHLLLTDHGGHAGALILFRVP